MYYKIVHTNGILGCDYLLYQLPKNVTWHLPEWFSLEKLWEHLSHYKEDFGGIWYCKEEDVVYINEN